MVSCWNTGMLSLDKPEERQLCEDSLDNWHQGQGGDGSKDMTWEW